MSNTTATGRTQSTTRTFITPVRYRDETTAVRPDRPPLPPPPPPRPQRVGTTNR